MPKKLIKNIIEGATEAAQSAVDVANQMTKDFLKSTSFVGVAQAAPKGSLAETRKKQGEGLYQADIGD